MSITFIPGFDVYRRVKSPPDGYTLLISNGYSIPEDELQEIASRVKMISFDWGGVLDLVFISNARLKKLLNDIFEEFKHRGIHLVIVSEGSSENIKSKLEELGWRDFFDVYQSMETFAIRPKREVLEELREEKGIKNDRVIIHFDDSPLILKKLGYQIDGKSILAIGVIGWRNIDEDFQLKAQELFQSTPLVVTDLKSIYDVLARILEYQVSGVHNH
jgi:FMN phosphatase YigB (HAD superfamily)